MRERIGWALLGAIVAALYVAAWTSVAPGGARTWALVERALLELPRGEITDSRFYVRTAYEMRRGLGYYDAVAKSVRQFDGVTLMPTVLAWRQPLLHWMWWTLSSPRSAYAAFWVLAGVMTVAAYLVARREAGPLLGLLAPLAVSRYCLSAGLGDWWWLQAAHNYAGAVWAMLALSTWRRPWAAAGFALLAGMTREFFLGLLPAGLIAGRDRRPWLLAALAFAAQYALHAYRVHQMTGVGVGATPWIGSGGPGFVWRTLTFGWPALWSPWVLAGLCALGVAGVVRSSLRVPLAAAGLLPPLVFLVIGGPSSAFESWGAAYVPFLLTAAPIGAAWVLQSVARAAGRPLAGADREPAPTSA